MLMVKSSVNPHKFRWFWWWISDGYGWWRIYLVSYVILFGNRTLRRLGRRYFRWIGRRYFWGLGTSRQKLTLSIFGLWPSLSLIVYPSLSYIQSKSARCPHPPPHVPIHHCPGRPRPAAAAPPGLASAGEPPSPLKCAQILCFDYV
jgi:hypothetical protein